MNYEIGDKFIFEIDRIYSSKKHEESRYGIKGFENLVLSKRKLNELLAHKNIEKLDEHDRTVAEDAFQVGFDSKSEWFQNDAYRRGLDDAWHAICLIEHVWTVREVEELFGRGFEQIYDMDIETVIETVKKHEEQKAKDAEIHLGDEVEAWDTNKWVKFIAICDNGADLIVGFDLDGGAYEYPKSACRKTGGHYQVSHSKPQEKEGKPDGATDNHY